MGRVRHEPIEILGSFESTFMPAHDRDVIETTEHDKRWREDLLLVTDMGITRLRYPIRWHRIEEVEGVFDWSETDEILEHMRDLGLRPIVDLVHHTSYPAWLTDGFADERFGPAYLRYAEAFARRYPWVEEYTLFNEPFATLFLCGHEAIWPPYRSGLESFVDLLVNVLPPVAEASRLYRELLPSARHVWNDSCERHIGTDASGQSYADLANERRFAVLDAFLGRPYDTEGPFGRLLHESGGERLLGIEGGSVDVLGLDYYAHNQWTFSIEGGTTTNPDPTPFADLIQEYWERYGLPCLVTETNIRGHTFDRATWLKYVLEQCEIARDRGIPIDGLCWFPFIDSTDWNSLLFRCEGHIDPVGVYWLDEELDRRASVMTTSYAAAAAGVPAVDLPAFELAEPVATWFRGYLPQTSHWEWSPPPEEPRARNLPRITTTMELRIVDAQ
ncbi:family 1 glycosylhydrolase [Naasia sp. SYSU D00948]|uniref:family 1 glycosylhydrolase n=1 Tax=Naasia sp. SYSU D00948 TaxID=2817379 RepID=UPI001B30E202|nr:family 1 glycosylhydrolase [Naasia sp. SYSU D00948]